MHLENFSYEEYVGLPREWRLSPLKLQPVNLIVGKNASGKTRVLNVINGLARMLSSPAAKIAGPSFFSARFLEKKSVWSYTIRTGDRANVTSERLKRGGKVLIERGEGGAGKIFAHNMKRLIDFQSPPEVLAATTRQDAIQHPYLNPLIEWAKGTYHFPFGTPLGKETFAIIRSGEKQREYKEANETVVVLYRGLRNYGDEFKQDIIQAMRRIGYDISDIGLMIPTTIEVRGPAPELHTLYVRERGIVSEVDQVTMSQGMFRALAIIIWLIYGRRSKNTQCMLVDDIGEGLDFDRATSLISFIIEQAEEANTQIIMTTNDRFVMNGVDLRYWSILDRQGPNVSVFNQENSAHIFEQFRFTGLSNFDFLATDYVHTYND